MAAEASKPKKRLVLAGAAKKQPKKQSKAPVDDGRPWYKTPQEAMAAAIAANQVEDPEKAIAAWAGTGSKHTEPPRQTNIKPAQQVRIESRSLGPTAKLHKTTSKLYKKTCINGNIKIKLLASEPLELWCGGARCFVGVDSLCFWVS